MFKTTNNCLWEERNTINTDVLIIGGGIVGAIHAYIFNEKNINTIVINKDSNKDTLKLSLTNYEIDEDFKRISSLLKTEDISDNFKLLLEAVYKLDEIIKKLGNNCDYLRNPILYYKNEEDKYNYIFSDEQINKSDSYNNGNYIKNFTLYNGLLSYNFGIMVNLIKLKNELYKHCDDNNVKIIEDEEIKDIRLYNKNVYVSINNYKIKCKKIIIAHGNELLFGLIRSIHLVIKHVSSKNKLLN